MCSAECRFALLFFRWIENKSFLQEIKEEKRRLSFNWFAWISQEQPSPFNCISSERNPPNWKLTSTIFSLIAVCCWAIVKMPNIMCTRSFRRWIQTKVEYKTRDENEMLELCSAWRRYFNVTYTSVYLLRSLRSLRFSSCARVNLAQWKGLKEQFMFYWKKHKMRQEQSICSTVYYVAFMCLARWQTIHAHSTAHISCKPQANEKQKKRKEKRY